MGVIIKERKRYTKPHAFYDGDYKRMEKEKFVAPGWNTYADSPYAEYERRVRQYGDYNTTDNSGNNRESKNRDM